MSYLICINNLPDRTCNKLSINFDYFSTLGNFHDNFNFQGKFFQAHFSPQLIHGVYRILSKETSIDIFGN